MRRLLAVLLVLVVGGVLVWALRGRFFGQEDELAATVSPEAAAQAEAKLQRLSQNGDSVQLSGVEITSLIRYRYTDQFPAMLSDARVAMSGDTLRLRARVPTERLPNVRELERARAFLPDTAPVEIIGRIQPLEQGRVALDIMDVRFANIPIPAHLYPTALERIGRRPEPGLAPTALPVRLPDGVGKASVRGGNLVLTPAR